MARITIEDCMEHVPNRFHLVRMASIRAKQLKKGALPLLTSEDNKQVVMSLREIAAGLVKPGNDELAISSDAEDMDLLAGSDAGAVENEAASAEEVQTDEGAPAAGSDEPASTSTSTSTPTNEG